MARRKDKSSAAIQAEVLDRQARICKAFANSTRLQMLDLLGNVAMPQVKSACQLIRTPNTTLQNQDSALYKKLAVNLQNGVYSAES